MKLNFLDKKKIIFRYPGEEFVLEELMIDKFLAAVEALLLEKNIFEFLDNFDIDLKHKKALIISQELFDRFVMEFTNLHLGKLKKPEKEPSENEIKSSLKEFYKSYESLLASLWKAGLGDPERIAKRYTPGQLDKWVQAMFPAEDKKETGGDNKISTPSTPRREGKLGFHNLPGGAKNVKVWTDKAGHECRSYEIRTERR